MEKSKEILLLLLYFTFGFQNLIMIGGLSISVYLYVLLLSIAVFGPMKMDKVYKKISAAFLFVLVIGLLSVVASVFLGHDMVMVMAKYFKIVQVYLLFILSVVLLKDQVQLNRVIQAFIFGFYVVLANVFFKFFTGNYEFYRLAADNYNQNYMSLGLVSAIPFAFYLIVFKRRHRLINFAYVILVFFAIMMSASRSGMINYLLTVSIVAIIYFQKILSKYNVLYFLIIAILTIYLLFVINVLDFSLLTRNIDRLLTSKAELESGNLNNRIYLWTESINVFLDHPMGVGLGQFGEYNKLGLGSQNGYLSVLVSLGFAGFVSYIVLLIYCFLFVYRTSIERTYKYLFFLVFVSMGLANTTSSLEFNEIFWAPTILVLIITNQLTKEEPAEGDMVS